MNIDYVRLIGDNREKRNFSFGNENFKRRNLSSVQLSSFNTNDINNISPCGEDYDYAYLPLNWKRTLFSIIFTFANIYYFLLSVGIVYAQFRKFEYHDTYCDITDVPELVQKNTR